MLNKHWEGTIFFGVANDGEAVGLSGQLGEETIRKISNRISLIVKPAIVPEISFQRYGDAMVIKLFAKGNNRPYSANGDYRIRVGSENKQIDPDLLADLF